MTEFKEHLEDLLRILREQREAPHVEYTILRALIALMIEREDDTREEDEQAQWIGKPIV